LVRSLATLVDRIYEAAVIPGLWRDVLTDVAGLAGAEDAALLAVRGSTFQGWIVSSPRFEELVVAHVERFPSNIRTQRLMENRHAGFVRDLDVLTQEEIDHSEVFQDFMIPRGYGNGVATVIASPSGDTLIVHAECSHSNPPVGRAVVDRLDLLRPHFARAALMSSRLELERAQAAAQALEVIGLPGAVTRRGGRILAANSLLTELMPDVVRDRPSRIALADPSADALLAAALDSTEANDQGAVRSIPIVGSEERPPIIVHVLPVRGAANDIFSSATAIVILTPVVPNNVPSAEVIRGLFDLTPSEARIAEIIGAGAPPRDAAVSLGITEETARTTLKRVLAKTGTHRQVELSALLRGATVPLRK
jgi:DNA-binding CsgD family transcriptional regulator